MTLPKLKAFVDNKSRVVKVTKFVLDRTKTLWQKAFSVFPIKFSKAFFPLGHWNSGLDGKGLKKPKKHHI